MVLEAQAPYSGGGVAVGDKSWKQWEREVASWFGGYRNPLSGRNNRDDKGRERIGDIIGVDGLVIECKLLKAVAPIRRAKETAKLAKRYGRGFVHVEREKGNKKLVCFVVDINTARKFAELLSKEGRIDSNEESKS